MTSAGPANESGQTLTVTAVTQGANGSVSTDGTTVTYTPNADFNGSDSLHLHDHRQRHDQRQCESTHRHGHCDHHRDRGNDRPIGNDDVGTTNEDGSTDIDVLANDFAGPANELSQTLSITGLSDPANGTATIDDNGTPADTSDDFVHYVPDADFFGTDTFLYHRLRRRHNQRRLRYPVCCFRRDRHCYGQRGQRCPVLHQGRRPDR